MKEEVGRGRRMAGGGQKGNEIEEEEGRREREREMLPAVSTSLH